MGRAELHGFLEGIHEIYRLKAAFFCGLGDLLSRCSEKNQAFYFSVEGIDPLFIGRTFVVAAADEPGGPVHGLNALDSCIRVGSLGIVIVGNTIFFRHILDPVLHRMEANQCIADLLQADAVGQRHGNCRHDVLEVMKAQKVQLVGIADLYGFFAVIVENRAVFVVHSLI